MIGMSFLDRILPARQQSDSVVPSDLTVSQLLDAIGGGADYSYFDEYKIGTRDIRNASLGFPTYYRCITLISSVIAQLLSGGALRIHNRDGEIVKTDRAKRVLDFFEYSPDGVTPAHTWIEDWCVDYLIEGNALCEVQRGVRNRLVGLSRLSVWDANTVEASDGSIVYRVRPIGGSHKNTFVDISEMNVMHSRWPRVLRHSASSSVNKWNFAAPPVRLMRPALEVGLAGDQYIKEWFKSGQNSTIGIALKQKVSKTQLNQLQATLANASKNRRPLLVGADATFTNLQNNAANKDQDALREFQVSDVSRVYGIPGPIMNQQVTQWGQGIEQLAKLFWKTCIKQHIDRMLAPANFHLLLPGQRFDVDPTDLLRGDITGIAGLITAISGDAQRDQVATTEEMRRLIGLSLKPEHGELQKATGDDNGMMENNEGTGDEADA